MARPLKPFIRGGGYYPSRRWIPLVYSGGYTTAQEEEDPGVYNTFSGSIVRFTAPSSKPIKSIIGAIEPVQSGSGDPSPDNVRPISGWTGATTHRNNVNMWDDSFYTGMTLDTETSSTWYGWYGGAVKVWENAYPNGYEKSNYGQISVLAMFGATNSFVFKIEFFYDDGTSELSSNITLSAGETRWDSRSSASGKNCIGYRIATTAGVGNMRGKIKDVFVIPYDGQSHPYTSYVPPIGNTYTIDWSDSVGTVYGGYFTIAEDGTVTVTAEWVSQTYNGTETYGYVASSPYVTIPTSSKHPTWSAGTPICSHFKCGSGLTKPFVQSGNSSTNYWLMLPSDTEWTDADKFKTWVAQQYTNGTPLQIVYKLATPITYTVYDPSSDLVGVGQADYMTLKE